LNLQYDETLSNFAFNFYLRRYIELTQTQKEEIVDEANLVFK